MYQFLDRRVRPPTSKYLILLLNLNLILSDVVALVVLRRFLKVANDPGKHPPNIRQRILKGSVLLSI